VPSTVGIFTVPDPIHDNHVWLKLEEYTIMPQSKTISSEGLLNLPDIELRTKWVSGKVPVKQFLNCLLHLSRETLVVPLGG